MVSHGQLPPSTVDGSRDKTWYWNRIVIGVDQYGKNYRISDLDFFGLSGVFHDKEGHNALVPHKAL